MRRRNLITLLTGSVIAWPLAARAQQKAMPVIGLLAETWLPGSGFTKGLSETGFVEGRNVAIDYRQARGQYDELTAMAADLASRRVALIAAIGSSAAFAAKRASTTTPIVFFSGEPVAEGLVANLARPGGNLTGVSLMDGELTAKRLELLSELVPRAAAFALLVNPNASTTAIVVQHAQDAARVRRLALHILKASTVDEIDVAFDIAVQLHADGLLVDADRFFTYQSPYLVNVASNHAVPTIYAVDSYAWAGGLISYGPDWEAAFRQLGTYAGRILKGAKPADLPVQQPTKFELVVNLKTAKALGLTVPQSIFARADKVIE